MILNPKTYILIYFNLFHRFVVSYGYVPEASHLCTARNLIDYGVVLEGEIELELDNGDRRLLKARVFKLLSRVLELRSPLSREVIVQRGTKHGWHNKHPTQWSEDFFRWCCLERLRAPVF